MKKKALFHHTTTDAGLMIPGIQVLFCGNWTVWNYTEQEWFVTISGPFFIVS